MKFGEQALFLISNFTQLTGDGAQAPAGIATLAGQTLTHETEEADRANAVNSRLLQHTASLVHGRHKLMLVAVNGEALPYHCPGQCLPLPGHTSDLDNMILASKPISSWWVVQLTSSSSRGTTLSSSV